MIEFAVLVLLERETKLEPLLRFVFYCIFCVCSIRRNIRGIALGSSSVRSMYYVLSTQFKSSFHRSIILFNKIIIRFLYFYGYCTQIFLVSSYGPDLILFDQRRHLQKVILFRYVRQKIFRVFKIDTRAMLCIFIIIPVFVEFVITRCQNIEINDLKGKQNLVSFGITFSETDRAFRGEMDLGQNECSGVKACQSSWDTERSMTFRCERSVAGFGGLEGNNHVSG